MVDSDRVSRERKGAFFTPPQWVRLSQEALTRVLGAGWQSEYFIWDCCAGTGNLLVGLSAPENVFASTLDADDVLTMHERFCEPNSGEPGQPRLLPEHLFQFDFLNDSFDDGRIPDALRNILRDERLCRRLVVYINPPYVEAGNARYVHGGGENRIGVAAQNATHSRYKGLIGRAISEVYAQFLIRVYQEIPGCILGQFSTLKIVMGRSFGQFREVFRPYLRHLFVVPGSTFENVRGSFPVGFFVWDTSSKEAFVRFGAEVFSHEGVYLGRRTISAPVRPSITGWIGSFGGRPGEPIVGYTGNAGPDYQRNRYLSVLNAQRMNANGTDSNMTKYPIGPDNLVPICVYYAVRFCLPITWVNDRDQFYEPVDERWVQDLNFQQECMIFTIFHGQNRISCQEGINHWIPFSEGEVGVRGRFSSHLVRDVLLGLRGEDGLLGAHLKGEEDSEREEGFKEAVVGGFGGLERGSFSEEAARVLSVGLELWRYYHAQGGSLTDASYYDIRAYFQGRDGAGRMRMMSEDEQYNRLVEELRVAMRALGEERIAVKAREYGFIDSTEE